MIQKKGTDEEFTKRKLLIFDTNIFLIGIDFNLIKGVIYTPPKVIEEITVNKYLEKNRNIINRIQAALDSKKLILKAPSDENLKKIEDASKLSGDYKALSDTDKDVLAIALDLLDDSNNDVIVYTNDYSMENLCSVLKIPFSPLTKKGIKSKIIWEVYCPICSKVYNAEDLNNPCEVCGLKLRRRPKK